MTKVLLIAGGGAAGSVLRYGVQKMLNDSFPFGTLTVNLLGCFLMGAFWALLAKGPAEALQLLLLTGFCGGFTTFSAFSVESLQLMTAGRWAAFGFYSVGSVAGGLLATFIGFKIFSS